MDGFSPATEAEAPPASFRPPDATTPPLRRSGWLTTLAPFRAVLLAVVAPTLLTAAFLYLITADQYESEARFILKSNEPVSGAMSGIGQAFGLSAASPVQSEARGL